MLKIEISLLKGPVLVLKVFSKKYLVPKGQHILRKSESLTLNNMSEDIFIIQSE